MSNIERTPAANQEFAKVTSPIASPTKETTMNNDIPSSEDIAVAKSFTAFLRSVAEGIVEKAVDDIDDRIDDIETELSEKIENISFEDEFMDLDAGDLYNKIDDRVRGEIESYMEYDFEIDEDSVTEIVRSHLSNWLIDEFEAFNPSNPCALGRAFTEAVLGVIAESKYNVPSEPKALASDSVLSLSFTTIEIEQAMRESGISFSIFACVVDRLIANRNS
jgi:hypothetical protein